LRDYQRYGVGWMNFLRGIGFGGCLADDMGVGKTAQVLALLEERRVARAGPSLVVAPKSLMFNWKAEAERFTPKLKVLLHTGAERDAEKIQQSHLVLTTYGTLLRDVVQLAESTFDYVILDEAQAIKNASTASAKAVRLLKANHRLALSGTPVENHLGELWSLFEFLNPGMLGESRVLRASGGLAQNPSEDARLMLAQALRPFILRRTKKQVASELPEKTEQTIYCELEGEQRKQYDELKRHYRDKLLGKTDARTWSRNRLQVLEALLRLRQAACHPGLIDERRRDATSAKLDTLLDQLAELREEGHKALVFSQFTSLLSIVQDRLQAAGVAFEYLDGKTRNREERVRRFQEDPACPVFLISLKAGGLGLNLTAAEYVFLLDPWWNPAVEAQAIDRAHRIGQTRNVFAYRLIARDTVEEKVLELQKSKRELADAILTEDNAVLRGLKPEDLALLLA
jgi:SNF2 family DNA or RNA helicase